MTAAPVAEDKTDAAAEAVDPLTGEIVVLAQRKTNTAANAMAARSQDR